MAITTKVWSSGTTVGSFSEVFDTNELSVSLPLVARVKNISVNNPVRPVSTLALSVEEA